MSRILTQCVLVCVILLTASCGSEQRSIPGADITGKWNVVLITTGQTAPSNTFGMSFTKNAATISGSEIAYTGGTTYNTGCINYGRLTASGNTNGGSVITLMVTDPSTNSSFTISGTADSGVTQINGSFQTSYGPNGSQPACTNTTGTIQFTRQ
jgi:hypothetical protein